MVTSPQYLGNTLMPVNAFQAKYFPKDELIKTKIMRNFWEKINTFWSKNVHSEIFLKNLTIMIFGPPKVKAKSPPMPSNHMSPSSCWTSHTSHLLLQGPLTRNALCRTDV